MAALSSGRQGVGVYLVCPLSRAALAASLINPGVSKSGSPAPNPTTSMPAFFMAAALGLTARGIDLEINDIRLASAIMTRPLKKKAAPMVWGNRGWAKAASLRQ